MEAQKRAFCDAMQQTFGNISASCKAVKISRQTYYNWKKEDDEFRSVIESEEYDENFLDLVEEKLMQKINSGDITAIIFAAKTKGKKRGYIERSEVDNTHTIQGKPTINLIVSKP